MIIETENVRLDNVEITEPVSPLHLWIDYGIVLKLRTEISLFSRLVYCKNTCVHHSGKQMPNVCVDARARLGQNNRTCHSPLFQLQLLVCLSVH